VGRVLLGKREGEEVTTELPWGKSKYRVIAINK
jgi:transcription elongation GreA/GreB family factor